MDHIAPPTSLPVTLQEKHNVPLNWGWVARHFNQPRTPPAELPERYHEAWLDGWDMAQDTPTGREWALGQMIVPTEK